MAFSVGAHLVHSPVDDEVCKSIIQGGTEVGTEQCRNSKSLSRVMSIMDDIRDAISDDICQMKDDRLRIRHSMMMKR